MIESSPLQLSALQPPSHQCNENTQFMVEYKTKWYISSLWIPYVLKFIMKIIDGGKYV